MIISFKKRWPVIHETAFVAPSADVIGDVEIGERSSIWFQTVIRGDVHKIKIGKRTNIQDHSLLHVTEGWTPLLIGDEVTIGHRVILHGCKVGNRVLVGMGSIILDGAEIGDECMIGAGALVTKNMKIPPRSLVLGIPGKVVRELKPEELAGLGESADHYVKTASEYQGVVRGPARAGDNQHELESLDADLFDDEGES